MHEVPCAVPRGSKGSVIYLNSSLDLEVPPFVHLLCTIHILSHGAVEKGKIVFRKNKGNTAFSSNVENVVLSRE